MAGDHRKTWSRGRTEGYVNGIRMIFWISSVLIKREKSCTTKKIERPYSGLWVKRNSAMGMEFRNGGRRRLTKEIPKHQIFGQFGG